MPDSATLKNRLAENIKNTMRSGDREKLTTLRGIMAAVKQAEIDTRKVLDDTDILDILDRLTKQRHESIEQFSRGGREDLVAKETKELSIIQSFLPSPLKAGQLHKLIEDAIEKTGAMTLRDMGKVMATLKPAIQGRADRAAVSALVKMKLTS